MTMEGEVNRKINGVATMGAEEVLSEMEHASQVCPITHEHAVRIVDIVSAHGARVAELMRDGLRFREAQAG